MKVLKLFGKIIAFIYSIVFFIILYTLLLLTCLSDILNPNFYGEIVKKLDLSQIKVTDIIKYNDDGIKDKVTTIEDFLVDKLEENGIPSESAKKIVDNEKIKDLVGTFAGDAMQYYVFEKEIPQLNNEKINDIIEELNLNDEFKNNNIDVDIIVDKANNEINKKFTVAKEDETEKNRDIQKSLKILFEIVDSNRLIIIMISFVIFSYFFLALLTWSLIRPMNFMGIPVLIIGVLFLLLRFGSGFIFSLLGNVEILSFLKQFTIMLRPTLIVGMSCLISGLLLIVLHSNAISIKTKNGSNDEPNFDIEDESNSNQLDDIQNIEDKSNLNQSDDIQNIEGNKVKVEKVKKNSKTKK